MNTFFVYILRSKKDGSLYIGQTNSLTNRLKKHNKGQIKSTKHRIPFELIYSEKYNTRREAMFREWTLKSIAGIKEKEAILKSLCAIKVEGV